MQEDYSPKCSKLIAYGSPSLTNHRLAGIIKDFSNVFESGIVGEVEHL